MDEKKVINHLFHEHHLILRNVIEMMIGESVDCYACGKGINIKECAEKVYVCSMHFESDDDHCSINNFILHKKCGELPDEIRHPIHPHHPLHLFDFRSLRGHRCDVCRRDIGMVLGYRCRSCSFDLDITCDIIGIDTLLEEKHELYHPSHPDHPLTLMRKPAFEFFCDGCGEVDVDMPYICSTCEFWVHKRCALLPLIHQYYPYHHYHLLSLAFSFPKKHRKYYSRCEVCDKLLDRAFWVYFCDDCRYFVHLKCVGSVPVRNSISDSSGVIQLPLHVDDIYMELITPFVLNIMRQRGVMMPAAATSNTVTFFDHKKHPLSLVSAGREARQDDDDELKKKMVMICSVCVTPISSPPYYQCTLPNCTPYFIHSICYSLPRTLQYSSSSHPQSNDYHHLLQLYGHFNKIHNHQNHKFELYTINAESNDKHAVFCMCNICGLLTNGMWYECKECDVRIDVKCASLPTTMRHASHPYLKPLILTTILPHQEKLRCRGCSVSLKNHTFLNTDIAYFCSSDDCDFALDLRCAQLPQSIREHQWNMNCNHSLLLTFDASLDHPSDFFCEFCEEEMDPKGWMYHCRQCDISVHLDCLDTASGMYRNISGVSQLPLHVDDIYKELITPFVMNMKREKGVIMPKAATSTTATFFDHDKHPLSLVSAWREAREDDDDDDDDDDELKKKMVMICSACVTPISSPPYYQCTLPNCTPYFIHSICYSLPRTLQYSLSSYLKSDESHHLLQIYGHYNKLHNLQNHKFELYAYSKSNNKDAVYCVCNICGLLTNGMWYECEECDVKIDVKCASLPTTIRHAFHPHHKPLILTRIPPHQEELRCRACRHTLMQDMISDIAYFCSSDDCDFALHMTCAQLPLSIRKHQWKMNCNHPLLLTYDAFLDHPSDFFCEFCEREMNPKAWMYHCRQCDISVDLYCLDTVSCRYRNIKCGRRFEMYGIHPHPLTFNHITLQKWCHLCSREVYNFIGFECVSCYYVVCLECGQQQLSNI